MKYKLCLIVVFLLLPWSASQAADDPAGSNRLVTLVDIPAIKLEGQKIDVSLYQFLGSWTLNPDGDWKSSIMTDLTGKGGAIQLAADEAALPKALLRRLTTDSEAEYFETISWGKEQVSALAFCAVADKAQTIMLELDVDERTAIYNNGKLIKEVQPSDTVETGAHLFVPVAVDNGNNLFLIKILSKQQPPRMRVTLVLDQSKDFQAAWNAHMGFLNKSIFSTGKSADAPMLKWDKALSLLTVSAEIRNSMTDSVVMTKEKLQTGSVIRDGPNYLNEGLYKISYASGENSAFEFFLIGSPRKMFKNFKELLKPALAGDEESALNIEAQIRRGEILLDRKNYNPESREWQDKVVYTLNELADFVKMLNDGETNLSKDVPGLHIRGFVSQIDQSKQYYRLFVPSSYAPNQGIPLLIILPVPVSQNRPFIESSIMATYHQTLQICRYAEKYGFAVVWAGYRNAPNGWPYENTHVDEVIRAVEKGYNIIKPKISLYGMCAGGFYAERLAATYPRRFAAIVYDRAYYDREIEPEKYATGSLKYWECANSPTRKVIDNKNLKIFVLNDGSKPEGHGEMKISEQFLKIALPTRPDIKYFLGQRPAGVELWDQIFGWLKDCKNENYSEKAVDDLASYGYVGPICEVFGSPFIVVEGTAGDAEGNARIQEAVKSFQEQYAGQFFGASFVLKKDSEVTDEDIRAHSLVLVGNPESNSVWQKLQVDLSAKLASDGLSIDGQNYPKADAFEVIARNPASKDYYVLLIGARDLKWLPLTKSINPTKATFDCCLLEPSGEYHRQRVITALLSTDGADGHR